MLSVYFDESGTHKSSPITAVGGLVASPQQWNRLTAEWQRILDDEGLTEFHMRHFAHSLGEFADKESWTAQRKDKLMRRLIPLIQRRVDYRTWAVVVMADFNRIIRRDGTKVAPYSAVAMACASSLRIMSIQRNLYLPYIFDQGKDSEKVFRGFDELEQKEAFRIEGLAKGDRRLCPPLQAADLHAWEVGKYFSDQAKGETSRVRGSLRELLRIPEAGVGGCVITGEQLRKLIGTVFLWRDDQQFSTPSMTEHHLTFERRAVLVPARAGEESAKVVYVRD